MTSSISRGGRRVRGITVLGTGDFTHPAWLEELREPGLTPDGAAPFRNLVQLHQIISELAGVGSRSKTVEREVVRLLPQLRPELAILEHVDLDDVRRVASAGLAVAIERLRRGQSSVRPALTASTA